MTRPDDLLSYCQLAQRAGASRGLAFERWRKFHRTSRREFEKVWMVARAAERLFTPEGGLRRE